MEDNIIFSYTRKQALEDGVLIDVTEVAKEAGVKYPTALTAGIWNKYAVPSEELKKEGQSLAGRLWDILWLFSNSARRVSADTIFYKVYFRMKPESEDLELATLKAVCGPNDDGTPCITIMLENED